MHFRSMLAEHVRRSPSIFSKMRGLYDTVLLLRQMWVFLRRVSSGCTAVARKVVSAFSPAEFDGVKSPAVRVIIFIIRDAR